MKMRRPTVCVISHVAKLSDVLKKTCGHMCQSVINVDHSSNQINQKELLKEADIIVSEPHFAHMWLDGLPKLKVVLGTWAGVEILIKLVRTKETTPQFTYCRFSGRFGQAMSEYVISYIVAQERNFRRAYETQAMSCWSGEVVDHVKLKSRSLDTLSIGILGLGDIGKKVANVCKALGMKVWAMTNSIPSDEAKCTFVDEYRTSGDLDIVLSNSDYICSILPSTPLTKGMLDGERFKACSARKSVFINVGRGDVCSEESILKALEEGWIGAAVLDVFQEEPLPSTSPLWRHPDITVTPHCAAVTRTQELSMLLKENIENYVHDRPLKYAIDWSKDY